MEYYIYVYLDPRKPGRYSYINLDISFLFEPIYIGLGKNGRKIAHLENKRLEVNSPKNSKLKKIINETDFNIKDYIFEVKSNLDHSEAVLQEIFFIKNIGRLDLLTGPLTNLTGGGEGVKNASSVTKQKMSKAKIGKKQTVDRIENRANKNTGQKRSDETKLKMRLAQLGKKCSDETKRKLSENHAGGRKKKG